MGEFFRNESQRIGAEKASVYQTVMVLSLASLVAFFWGGNQAWLWGAAGLLLSGVLVYPLVRVVHKAWMALGHALGWVNTRILLGLMYFLMLWPLAMLRRVIRPGGFALKPDPSEASYFQKGQPISSESFERMW